MLSFAKIYFIAFGLLTMAGGIMGYVKANSVPSLIAGGIAGILLAAGGFLLKPDAMPIVIGLGVVSLALAGRFLPAFLKTQAMMPAGLMAVLAIIGVIIAAAAFFQK